MRRLPRLNRPFLEICPPTEASPALIRRYHHRLPVLIVVALLAVSLSLPTARVARSQSGSSAISAREDQEALLAGAAAPCRRYCVGWAVGGSAVGDPAQGGSAEPYGVILRTDDGGVTWQRQGQSGEIPDVYLSGVSAVNDRHAWAVGGDVILHTRNGGLTWERQELPPGLPQDLELSQVKALDRHTAFAVGSPSVLLRTGGRSGSSGDWVRMPAGRQLPTINFQDVDAVGARHVWAVGSIVSAGGSLGGLAIAFFNGRRWKPQLLRPATQQVPCSRMIGISALGKNTAWAVGGESCPPYRTVDGGASWRAMGGPVV